MIFILKLHLQVVPMIVSKQGCIDFGIIGMTEPQYDPNRCVSCGACVKGCDKLSVDALKMENYRIVRNEEKMCGMWSLCNKMSDQSMDQKCKKNTIV